MTEGLPNGGTIDPRAVERLFDRAADLPEAARASFLRRECAGNEALRLEVASLLHRLSDSSPDDPRDDVKPSAPPTDRVGPYRLLGQLGRGGMGVVYRARHEDTGREVALKTVKVPNAALLASIRREIHALASLTHPGIIPILDEGLEGGMPWYAMELLQGLTLRDRTRPGMSTDASMLSTAAMSKPRKASWWTSTLHSGEPSVAEEPSTGDRYHAAPAAGRLPEVLTLVRRLCSPLAYMHGEGLVHRDLKPENILVRPDGMPVIVDFGLATSFAGSVSREKLQAKGHVVGTVAYMSPEQVNGDLVDARSDIYALGCILFELLTGRPPFVGETPLQVLMMHLMAEVPRPSTLTPGIPAPLEDLVVRMLAKDPRHRIGYADDLAARLASLGVEGSNAMGPAPRAYLYRPTLSGRKETLGALTEKLSQLEAGVGALILIGGESGVGKTRLLTEVTGEARKQGFEVLIGECQQLGGRPLELLAQPLQTMADFCRHRGLEETERVLGRRGKVLAAYEASLRDLPGQDRHPEPATLPPDAGRIRLFTCLAESFQAMSELTPLLLILDDLQWADDMTLGFLEHAFRGDWLKRGRIRIVGSYRTEEVSEGLTGLLRLPVVERLVVPRLQPDDVGAIVRDMLALPECPATLRDYLAEQSEGNPFFVGEYLRTAVGEGLFSRTPEGQWRVGDSEAPGTRETYERLRLPSGIQALVSRRLDGLSGGARELLQAACVLGREIDLKALLLTASMPEPEALSAWEELLTRHVLEEEQGRTRFTHDKLRDVAYERIADALLPTLHGSAADAIEQTHTADRESFLPRLGFHRERAGQMGEARSCYLAGARAAVKRYDHKDAERLYRSFLSLSEVESAESVTARIELGEDLKLQGSPAQAEAEFRTALQGARALGDQKREGETLASLGALLRERGTIGEARTHIEQALSICRKVGDRRGEGNAFTQLGTLEHSLGRIDEARARYEEALVSHREVGNRGGEGSVLANLGLLLQDQGLLDEAREHYQQALALHREVGNRQNEGIVLGNLGTLFMGQGLSKEARAHYEQALAIHRELGDRRLEGCTLANLGLLYNDEGRVEEWRAFLEQALAIHREVGDRSAEAIGLDNLGNLHAEGGRPEEARVCYEAAISIFQELGERRNEGIALANLGGRVGVVQDVPRALALLDRAEELLALVGDRDQLGKVLCARGHVMLADGNEPRDVLERARAFGAELGPHSTLACFIAKLGRATDVFRKGGELVAGYCAEDLTQGQLRWLRQNVGGRSAEG